jgi:hypothetical protein
LSVDDGDGVQNILLRFEAKSNAAVFLAVVDVGSSADNLGPLGLPKESRSDLLRVRLSDGTGLFLPAEEGEASRDPDSGESKPLKVSRCSEEFSSWDLADISCALAATSAITTFLLRASCIVIGSTASESVARGLGAKF